MESLSFRILPNISILVNLLLCHSYILLSIWRQNSVSRFNSYYQWLQFVTAQEHNNHVVVMELIQKVH